MKSVVFLVIVLMLVPHRIQHLAVIEVAQFLEITAEARGTRR